jgi:multidrug efflux pump subunit AcrB
VEVILDRPRAREDHTRELEDTLITTTRGAAVPLRAVAEIHPTFSYAQLQRRNGRRIVEVTADVAGTALPDEIVARVDDALRQRHWERGYGYSYGGEREKTEQSFAKLGLAAACALLAIFLLLLSMFHSITLAAIVLGAVPYVLIGVLGGLAATHTPFGFMAFLGLVALTGVYVNHKIYFIDRMRHLMASGHEWQGAVVQGVVDRIRPVVLTALTAVLGLLPLTLGGGPTWAAFGWVNVFGLLASIPLSLVLVPAFVSLAFRLRRPRAHSPLALERDAEDDTVRMDVRGISF